MLYVLGGMYSNLSMFYLIHTNHKKKKKKNCEFRILHPLAPRGISQLVSRFIMLVTHFVNFR